MSQAISHWRSCPRKVEGLNGNRPSRLRVGRGSRWVAVGNSKAYGGGMYVLPDAELDDGCLDIMFSLQTSKLRFIRGVFKTFNGSHVNDDNATFLRGEHIEISADRPFQVYADGDVIADLPVSIRVAKRVLRVLVPSG